MSFIIITIVAVISGLYGFATGYAQAKNDEKRRESKIRETIYGKK